MSTRQKLFTALVFLCIGLAFAAAGCGKKETPKEEKAVSAEKGNEEKGKKEEGKEKEKEEPGIVELSEEKQKMSGIEVMTVSAESVAVPLTATAMIELNADRVSKVSPRVTGRVMKITVSQGDRVMAGQPLAYIDSVELDQAWSDYIKTKGKNELALKKLKREETLFEKKVSPEKDVLTARQELSETEADLNLSKERFRLLGIDVSKMEGTGNDTKNGHPLIPVSSPIGGGVIDKAVTQGEVVGPDKPLFTVAELSTVWVLIDIYEKDIARLKTGMAVKVSALAFPDREFRGVLSYIGDVMDEKTRTVKARVTVNNGNSLLKPGMFASVIIDVKSVRPEKLIALPAEAVLMEGSENYVFVQVSPEKFKRKGVVAGRTLGRKIEITEGIKEGASVVVKGYFILKSELKKDELAEE